MPTTTNSTTSATSRATPAAPLANGGAAALAAAPGEERPLGISVVLADDHGMVREALARCLASSPDVAMVEQASNGRDAVHAARRLRPAVVVLDIDMPGLGAFDAARQIQKVSPGTRVVFLSAFSHDRYIEQALAAKAAAYITKGEPLETVLRAIHAVVRGRVFFSNDILARIVLDGTGPRLADARSTRASSLSPREIEVLRCVARGLAKKEIASHLCISVHTVNRHVTDMMDKLGIHDRVGLARFAIREGLAEP